MEETTKTIKYISQKTSLKQYTVYGIFQTVTVNFVGDIWQLIKLHHLNLHVKFIKLLMYEAKCN